LQGWQVFRERKLIRQVFELPCRHPDNTASKAAIKAARLFERINYSDVVFVYGDPSANAKSTTDDDGRSFFDKFTSKLRDEGIKIINRVQKSAPEVALSGAFVNEIYESNYHGWTIEINVDCRVSIEDYIMAKEDMEGKILKKRITDKETDVSFEKYGHFSDDKRYFITTILNAEFNIYKQRRKKYYGV
jgi:phage terminase large subunit